MAKAKKCKIAHMIFGYFLLLLGIYLLTAGLIGKYNPITVLKGPIFWGIFLIFSAIYHHLYAPWRKLR